MLATLPKALSARVSITVPIAYLFGLALSSLTSAIASTVSSKESIPKPVTALILTNGIFPPQASGVKLSSAISCIILSGFALGLSILLTATTIGTPALIACSTASLV